MRLYSGITKRKRLGRGRILEEAVLERGTCPPKLRHLLRKCIRHSGGDDTSVNFLHESTADPGHEALLHRPTTVLELHRPRDCVPDDAASAYTMKAWRRTHGPSAD